jgi:hypothetical protein
MWFVTNVKGKNGLPLIRIHSGVSKASADIYLFGATVTSYADKTGNENIFVSSNAIFNGVKAIRGGEREHYYCFQIHWKYLPIEVTGIGLISFNLSRIRHSCCISSIWTALERHASARIR